MDQSPLFVNQYILSRILREMALRLGLDIVMADTVAQIHAQQSTTAQRWSKFLETNCSDCTHSIATCKFMSPDSEMCIGDSTPESVKNAYAHVIESGSLEVCPVRDTDQK